MLPKEDIEFIKQNLGTWLTDASLSKPAVVYEIELRERMIRVEEELKHQRELMQQGFAQNEKRFEQVDKQIELLRIDMDKRFEQVDKRFEQVDKRFEQVDKRFEQVDKRFEAMDQRFTETNRRMDQKFDEMTKRIDQFMKWSFMLTLTTGGLVVAILKFWI